jgi:SET domain-containing protein
MAWEQIPADEIRHALLLEDGSWLVDRGLARYANHSCDPNCRVDADNRVVTLRAVKAGEEITLAYNVVYPGEDPGEWDVRWSFDCACGARNCRSRVDGYVTPDGARWKRSG